MSDVATVDALKEFDCPRCGQAAAARFYGPCDPCRQDLRANLGNEQREIEKVVPACRWTKGTWEALGLAWNEIQNTPQHVKRLQDALVRAYAASNHSKK